MSQLQISVDELNQLQPMKIVRHPAVRDRFIQVYDTLWGDGQGAAAYERQAHYFNTVLRDAQNGALQRCTHLSIFTAFLDLAICGLSLEPGSRAECYLLARNYNMGDRERPSWESRVMLTISGYGELVQRARSGQIKYADNPVVVYDNDEFSFSERDGRKAIDYTCHFPHTGHKIVAAFMKIVRNDNSVDYAVMYEEDWQRLAAYSAKQDRRTRKPNELYVSGENGGIDPGFLCAKLIKHAFKTYPRVKVGRATQLESQQVDEPKDDDLYGLRTDGQSGLLPNQDAADEEPQQQQAPEATEPAAPQAETVGVTVDPDEEDGF